MRGRGRRHDAAHEDRIRLDRDTLWGRGAVERHGAGVARGVEGEALAVADLGHPHGLNSKQRNGRSAHKHAAHAAPGAGRSAQRGERRIDRHIVARRALAALAQRTLEEAVREIREDERNGDDDNAQPPGGALHAQVRRGQDEQRPVPQVERVGDVAEPACLLRGHGLGQGSAAAQDDEHGTAERQQGQRTGVGRRIRDKRARADEREEAEARKEVGKTLGDGQLCTVDGEHAAERELPRTRPRRVVVCGRAVETKAAGVREGRDRDDNEDGAGDLLHGEGAAA